MKSCFNGYLTDECLRCEYCKNDDNQIGCAVPFPIMDCEAFAKMAQEEEQNRI